MVYVSSKTPFMSAVKRVQKLLKLVDKRETQAATAHVQNTKKRKYGSSGDDMGDIGRIAAILAENKTKDEGKEGIVLKATGKAIEKALNLALWFQQREEYRVTIKTSSVGAIDDIVPRECADVRNGQMQEKEKGTAGPAGPDVGSTEGGLSTNEEDNEPHDIPPESRIRYASVIEVMVSSR